MISLKPSLQNLTVQGRMRNIANVYIAKIIAYYENKMKTGLKRVEPQYFASPFVNIEITALYKDLKGKWRRGAKYCISTLRYCTFFQFFGIFGKLEGFHYFLQIAIHYTRQIIYSKTDAVFG